MARPPKIVRIPLSFEETLRDLLQVPPPPAKASETRPQPATPKAKKKAKNSKNTK